MRVSIGVPSSGMLFISSIKNIFECCMLPIIAVSLCMMLLPVLAVNLSVILLPGIASRDRQAHAAL
jgi:hypothetical protein